MSADNKSEKTGRSGPAKRQREATRTAILQSVGRIVSEEGADALTIDEVARAAALSKGGVLHHFPSKEALLLAAIRHDLDLFDEMVAHLEESDPGMPGAYTRAYLRVCVKSFERAHDEGLAFLHQFRSIPSTIELVREYKARWHQRLEEDGLDAAVAHLVRYTGDGVWLAAIAGEQKPASFETMVDCLLRLAGAGGGRCSVIQVR